MSLFGPIGGRGQVEAAVINVLRTWNQTYVAEVERQLGLPARSTPIPPAPSSFSGGVDFDTWMQGSEPCLITVVEPFGEAERVDGAGNYLQNYQVQVACILVADNEDDVRAFADVYGAAVMGAVVQNGNLGGLAISTDLVHAPRVEWIDPQVRRTLRTVVEFRVLVGPIVLSSFGPDHPDVPYQPYVPPGDFPTVTEVDIEVDGGPGTESSHTIVTE